MNTQQIAEKLNGELRGKADLEITGAEQIERATAGQITFIGSRNYLKFWDASNAGAAIVDRKLANDIAVDGNRAIIVVDNADLAMAQLLELIAPPQPRPATGVHPTAIVHDSVKMGQGVSIGAYCYVGPGVELEDGVTLQHRVSVFDDTRIGRGTHIWTGTVIRERCTIGMGCLFHPNVTIGADGFGFRPSPDGRGVVKIPQIGTVEIGNGVEIGANSCVDRGKFSATVIGDGSKIDNLVQIAHNVKIGRVCMIAANVGIAGSTELGDGVMIGGGASIKDHTKIGSGAIIAACAGVIADVPAGQQVLGAPAGEYRAKLKEWVTLRRVAARESK
ncbi:UDP-3-O-(3-hydroxymyristoyl)glucosamine N-acyltransferase [Lewinellaceae bacterium SD302]|nr:UDP-3-O-(3-hydroxymyristoyl)glucosamine N-acyltransferase [Lewinellaceae bacterium SD302]